MKIEKGKFYKSRDGQKYEILKTDAIDIPIVAYRCDGGHILSLHRNGCVFDDKSLSIFDLIAEWTEPVEIPWSDYPTWCKFVAMDVDGRWFGFTSLPIKKRGEAWYSTDVIVYIPPDYTPRNFTGDWTESLFERP
jgi:hypothetical protein